MKTGHRYEQRRTTASPWAGMSVAQHKQFIDSVGGLEAAANYILSRGHSKTYARNQKIRETRLQGRGVDNDRDDLSSTAIQEKKPKAGARALDRDYWNAILALYPQDGWDRDVLIASAQEGQGETRTIGARVGVTQRQVRNIQDKLLGWTQGNLTPEQIAAHLDDPITMERIVNRPKSTHGRKPQGWAAPAAVVDLFGDPITERKPHQPRKVVPRMRVCAEQMSLFQVFQEAA